MPDYEFKPENFAQSLVPLLHALDSMQITGEKEFFKLMKLYPKSKNGYFAKSEIMAAFVYFSQTESFSSSLEEFNHKLRKKPIRTISGVTPVTVLTKPFPCPGKCIFCPNDIRMPKSYLSDEPGAQRATRNAFDPYLQTWNRLKAFKANGHSTSKIELIILGGTWSFYPEVYQIWFVKRCFDAMNDFGNNLDNRDSVKRADDFSQVKAEVKGNSMDQTYNQAVSKELVQRHSKTLINTWEKASWEELEAVHTLNETNECRNVGLVIETRPDHISEAEVVRIRRLGCTKTQIGFQSLSDSVLEKNKRGHDIAATRQAMRLLRQAGLKIHAHWMANLYGSTVYEDIEDYKKMFADVDFKPDEVKLYPCSLIESAELMQFYEKGLWKPYSQEELLKVVTECLLNTPEYCRLSRVIRDIPGGDIVDGNKLTNFRQIAENHVRKAGLHVNDIRAREIKDGIINPEDLKLDVTEYQTSVSRELFLQYITPKREIVGFLRLSLPLSHIETYIPELVDSAIIREVHVYGFAATIGEHRSYKAQHLGIGKKLVQEAKILAKKYQFKDLSVISAIGTREYYRKLGFNDGTLYQHFNLSLVNKDEE